MKKLLVRTSFVTSVEVSDIATEEEIMVKAKFKLIEQIVNDFEENVEEIVPDTELTVIEDNTPKGESEIVCDVKVTFIDNNGVEHTLVTEHNGEGDCWNIIECDGRGFDVNTYDATVYGDKENHALGVAVDEVFLDGEYWSRDNSIPMEVKSFEIIQK